MVELPSWAGAVLEVFYYAFVVPGLIAYAVFFVALLISPAVLAVFGGDPLWARIGHGLVFCLWAAIMALHMI